MRQSADISTKTANTTPAGDANQGAQSGNTRSAPEPEPVIKTLNGHGHGTHILQLVIDIPEYVELLNAAAEADRGAGGNINRAVEDLLLHGRMSGFETTVRLDQPPTTIPFEEWSCSTDVDSVITYGRHLPMGSGHFKEGPPATLFRLTTKRAISGGICCDKQGFCRF